MNKVIGFAIGNLQFAVHRELGVRVSVKEAMGQRAADAVVENDKQQSPLSTLCR